VHEKSERPNIEIERKFLVANDDWRQLAVRSVNIRDGLIAVYKDRKVRVRLSGDIATIAIKGPRIGIVRPEFEYEIPIADAERMLSTMCQDDTLEKQRFFVEDAGATWHVDVYGRHSPRRCYCRNRAQAREPRGDPAALDRQGSDRRFVL
jgi:CYTH domain-containing protein